MYRPPYVLLSGSRSQIFARSPGRFANVCVSAPLASWNCSSVMPFNPKVTTCACIVSPPPPGPIAGTASSWWRSRLGGDHPRGGAEADPNAFVVPILEFAPHGAEHVIPAVPVDEPEQPFRHAHVEEEVDRVVGAASTSEDDRGSARVARNLFEPGGTEQRRDVVRLGEREHARSAR